MPTRFLMKFLFVGFTNLSFCYFQATIGGHLGIASHVNITRSLFGVFKLLDDGGNGNVVVSISQNNLRVVGWEYGPPPIGA